MDLSKVIQQLHEERARLDAAILSLERLQESGHRRGRPPLLLTELKKADRPARKQRAAAVTEPHG